MTRSLRIERVVAERFGRFSQREIELTPGFCVVHGPNESGKSTLSELIAWLLVGIGDTVDASRTLRYGSVGDPLSGRLVADLAGSALTLERRFNARHDRRASLVGTERAWLDGAPLDIGRLHHMLGLVSADEYDLRYRITESSGLHSVGDLMAGRALGASGERTPSEVISTLRELAGRTVPGVDDARRISAAHTARKVVDEARALRAGARASLARGDELRRGLTGLATELADLDEQSEQMASRLGELRLALRLLDTGERLRRARVDLEGVQDMPPEWLDVLGRRHQVAAAVSDLVRAEAHHVEATEKAERSIARHSLTAEQLSGVHVPVGIEQRVVAARVAIETARQLRDEALAESRRAELGRREIAERFDEVLVDMGLDHEAARGFADARDGSLFDGPFVAWERAEQRLAEAEADLPSAQEAQRAAEATATARRNEFDAAGGGDAARIAAGVSDPVAQRGSALVPLLLGLAMVASGVAALVEPLAAVISALTTAIVGVAWWVRSARAGRGDDPSAVDSDVRSEAARALLAAEEQVRLAVASVQSMVIDVERHRASIGRHRDELSEFYAAIGLPPVASFQHARVLRNRHGEMVRLHDRLAEIDRTIATAAEACDRADATVSSAEHELNEIAGEIGLVGRGALLDGDAITELRNVCRARDDAEEAGRRVAEIRRMLGELTGSERLAALDASAIEAQLTTAIDLDRKRTEAAGLVRDLERELDAATVDRPGVIAMLDEVGLSAEVIELRIDTLTTDLARTAQARDALVQRRADLAHELRVVEERSDLPAISFVLAQAEQDLADVVWRGAAIHFAQRLIAGIQDDFERLHQPRLVRRASELVTHATGGEWAGLVVDEERRHFTVVRPDGARHRESELSAGAMELLRVAVRVAVAEAHGEQHGIALPLVCDDPTGDIDSDRSPRLFEILAEAAQHRQVLLFTHDERSVDLARAAGAVAVPMPS